MSDRSSGPRGAELANRLRAFRAEHGSPTYESLSRVIHVSPATLSRLFNGQIVPGFWLVQSLVRVLDPNANLEPWRRLHWEAEKEFEERKAITKPRLTLSPRQESSPEQAAATDAAAFKHALRKMIDDSGLSLREAAARSRIARSTLSDALNGERLPSRETVAALARTCGAKEEDWVHAVDLLRGEPEGPRAVRAGNVGRETVHPRDDLTARLTGATPAEAVQALLAGAATRPPADIAALAITLRQQGHTRAADSLLAEVARTRTIDEVAAIAVALLDTVQTPGQQPAKADEQEKPGPGRFWQPRRRSGT